MYIQYPPAPLALGFNQGWQAPQYLAHTQTISLRVTPGHITHPTAIALASCVPAHDIACSCLYPEGCPSFRTAGGFRTCELYQTHGCKGSSLDPGFKWPMSIGTTMHPVIYCALYS